MSDLDQALLFIDPIKAFYIKVKQAEAVSPSREEVQNLLDEYKRLLLQMKKADLTKGRCASFCKIGLEKWLETLIFPLSCIADQAFPETRVPTQVDPETGEMIAYSSSFYANLLTALV